MSERVKVSKLPPCDICTYGAPGFEQPKAPMGTELAHYDGKTVFGPWANMCEAHFQTYGTGLGTGRGQELIVPGSDDE